MSIAESLRGGLIVSCQAWSDDPLHDPDVLRRIAEAALRGGARGLRADSPQNIAAMRTITALPIIGLYKRFSGNEVRITPDFESARSIAEAGADILAIECTQREALFGELWRDVLRRIHDDLHLPVLADISTIEEAWAAVDAGADAVATTLAGYTPQSSSISGVAWDLLRECIESLPVPVLAEGHIGTPQDAARALQMGAYAVIVGSAITRPREITQHFVRAMQTSSFGEWALGVDIGGTNVKAGLVNRTGELLFPEKIPTTAARGAKSIANAAETLIAQILNKNHGERALCGIGIASAGAIDAKSGAVFAATDNLPGWTGFPLRTYFAEKFQLPVFVENDGHAAALAELHFGAGRSFNDMVVLTLGTGLGGGIIQNRQLLRHRNRFYYCGGNRSACRPGSCCSQTLPR
jgi:putative N-acetylmannosamine-6-phosphate epimerase